MSVTLPAETQLVVCLKSLNIDAVYGLWNVLRIHLVQECRGCLWLLAISSSASIITKHGGKIKKASISSRSRAGRGCQTQTTREPVPEKAPFPSPGFLRPFTSMSSSLSLSSCHGIDLWLLCGIMVWVVPLTLLSRGIGQGVRKVCLQGFQRTFCVWEDLDGHLV